MVETEQQKNPRIVIHFNSTLTGSEIDDSKEGWERIICYSKTDLGKEKEIECQRSNVQKLGHSKRIMGHLGPLNLGNWSKEW